MPPTSVLQDPTERSPHLLVITRRPDEAIVIETKDGPVTVMVLNVKGEAVRLGVKAKRSIPVWRSELLDENGKLPPRDDDSDWWPEEQGEPVA